MSSFRKTREKMTSQSESLLQYSPIPEDLMEKLFGFCGSQAIITGFKLGIFDVIHNTKTDLTAKEISEKQQTNAKATERLLNTLVSLNLLEKTRKQCDYVYKNTATSEKFLVQSSSNSIKGIVPMLEKSYRLYENLEFAVKEGENQWRRTYNGFFPRLLFTLLDLYQYVTGRPWNVFSLIYATKRGVLTFLEGLKGSCKPEAGRLMSAFDLSSFTRIVDLGGGTGDLSFAASMLYPNMSITVMDLPAVVDCLPDFKPSSQECPTVDKVVYKSGDIFDDLFPPADLFVLGRILQSFNEFQISFLLKKIFFSLPIGGGILICEKVLDDDKTGPLLGTLSSLTMLVVGNRDSRERSGVEFQELLESSGFGNVQIKQNVGTFMDAILAVKLHIK